MVVILQRKIDMWIQVLILAAFLSLNYVKIFILLLQTCSVTVYYCLNSICNPNDKLEYIFIHIKINNKSVNEISVNDWQVAVRQDNVISITLCQVY